jgi:Fe2+ transport system protein FeoA
MVFYEIYGVRPGAGLRITDRGPLNGPLTVDVDGQEVSMSPDSAAYLWVWPPVSE